MSVVARLKVNGEPKEYSSDDFPANVTALIESLALDPQLVVAEVNGDIVKRVDFSSKALADGDVVEIVRFVGGG